MSVFICWDFFGIGCVGVGVELELDAVLGTELGSEFSTELEDEFEWELECDTEPGELDAMGDRFERLVKLLKLGKLDMGGSVETDF